MRRWTILVALFPTLAFAQPGQPVPEPAPAEPAPAESAPAEPAPAEPAPAELSPPSAQPPAPVAPLPPPNGYPHRPDNRGVTGEIAAGLGFYSNSGGGSSGVVPGFALDLGVGGFVTPRFAISVRASGTAFIDEGVGYVGVLGPNVQGWLSPQFWVGGGIGVGFFAGCSDGCGAVPATLGADFRLGYAFSESGRGANVSFEVSSLVDGGDSLRLIGLLVGYQGF